MKEESVVDIAVRTQRDFVITYFAMLSRELADEKIITPSQGSQIRNYILKKLNESNEGKEDN